MPYTLLGALLAYRRLGRGRLRMVLEAIEDHQRGWRNGKTALAEERVTRGTHTIEHVLPRKWLTHWPQPDGPRGEAARDRLVHTFGNLTLLTGKLNAKVSNGPWLGVGGKREGLDGHSVLLLNRELLKKAGDQWTDEAIRARTQELAEVIIQIWPVPQDHRSGFSPDRPRLRKKVQLSDLVNGGALNWMSFCRKTPTIVSLRLPDPSIDMAFSSPSICHSPETTNGGHRSASRRSPDRPAFTWTRAGC